MKKAIILLTAVIGLNAFAQITDDVPLDYGLDELQIFDRQGTELAYLDSGSGEPIFFIHGAFSDYRVWTYQIEALKGEYRTIAYSDRGSYPNPPSRDLTLARRTQWDGVADAAALLEHLQVDSGVIVAHSAGGTVAMNLALERPDLIAALVLIEPAVIVSPPIMDAPDSGAVFLPPAMSEAAQKISTGQIEAGVRQFIDFVSGEGFFDAQSPNAQQILIDNAYSGSVGSDPVSGGQPASNSLSSNFCEVVGNLQMPVLYVAGETSPQVDMSSHCFANMKKVVIEDASHGVFYEKPEEFNRALSTFLDDL